MEPGGGMETHHIGAGPIEDKNWIEKISSEELKTVKKNPPTTFKMGND